MSQPEDDQAGLGKGRMEAFSDGVFAIAITLLVLEIHVPQAKHTRPADLPAALWALLPQFLSYALSFVIVGVYWVAHHLMMHALRRVDRTLLWLNILFLGCITLIPVSADLLGQFRTSPIAVAVYGANLVLTSASLLLWWVYATYKGRLLAEGTDARYVRVATIRTSLHRRPLPARGRPRLGQPRPEPRPLLARPPALHRPANARGRRPGAWQHAA